MNRWNLVICAFAAASLIAGCAMRGGNRPEWVDNPKLAYPENLYLVAVGEGDTRQAAENSAAKSSA